MIGKIEMTREEVEKGALFHLAPFMLVSAIASIFYLNDFLLGLSGVDAVEGLVNYVNSMKWILYPFIIGFPLQSLFYKHEVVKYRLKMTIVALLAILLTVFAALMAFNLILFVNGMIAVLLGGTVLFAYPALYREIAFRAFKVT